MGRSVYEQPGTKVDGSYHTQEGFQISKGKWKRGKGESEKGSKRQGDCAIITLSVYMHVHDCCNCLNVAYNCLNVECN
jgi:hypothetical protein